MKPPETYDMAQNEGFIAETTKRGHQKWRSLRMGLLKKTTIGKLLRYTEDWFFMDNEDVTKAYYKVEGYRFQIAVYFDNKTGKRIA